MDIGSLGSLFGGLAQGAEAGISLSQKQQQIELQQSQQGIGLLNAMVNMRRMPLEMRKIVMPGILKQYEKSLGTELPKTMYDMATKADDNMWPKAVDALVGTLPQKFDRASIAAWAKQADDPEMQLKVMDQIRKLTQGEESIDVRRTAPNRTGSTTVYERDEYGNIRARTVTPGTAPQIERRGPGYEIQKPPQPGVAQTDDQKAAEVTGLLDTANRGPQFVQSGVPRSGPTPTFAPPSPALEGPQQAQATPPTTSLRGDETKKGEDYLATVTPNRADLIRKIGNYDVAGPSPSSRNTYDKMLREDVIRAFPDYDETKFPTQKAARVRMEVNATTGQMGQTAAATRTAYNHLASLAQAYDALKNGDIQLANRLINTVRRQTGEPQVAPVDTAALAVGTEIAKALRGAGALSLEEEKRWASALNAAANSPAQMKATIGELDKLIQGRFSEMQAQYQSVFKGKQLPGMDSPEYAKSRAFISQWTKPAEKAGTPTTPGNVLSATNPKTGKKAFSRDGGKTWTDENGKPVQ